MFLPDGFVFSPYTTQRDWTDDTLKRIRAFYSQFADSGGGEKVNLQGIIFDTNQGGRLPVEKYLLPRSPNAGLAQSSQVDRGRCAGAKSECQISRNALGEADQREPVILAGSSACSRPKARPEEAAALATQIAVWQKSLWKFQSVGQIGKVGGPKAWQEPVTPLVASQDLRFKIPSDPASKELDLYLVAAEAGDGSAHDSVVWRRPRLVMPGGRELLLRDVRSVSNDLEQRRATLFASTAKFLKAVAEASSSSGKVDPKQLAQKHNVDLDGLIAWLDYLGLGNQNSIKIENLFTSKIPSVGGYDFVQGWGTSETPLLIANSSDRHVRVPGNMKPHGVAVHRVPPCKRSLAGAPLQQPFACRVKSRTPIPRQRRHLVAGIAAWFDAAAAGCRRLSGRQTGQFQAHCRPIHPRRDVVSLLIGPRTAITPAISPL